MANSKQKNKIFTESSIGTRLNIIIGLLFELIDLFNKRMGNKELSETAKMGRLRQFGLNNKEIGLLFGKGGKEVAKQIYELKRKKKKEK